MAEVMLQQAWKGRKPTRAYGEPLRLSVRLSLQLSRAELPVMEERVQHTMVDLDLLRCSWVTWTGLILR